MPRKPRSYRDAPAQQLEFLANFAQLPIAAQELGYTTNPAEKKYCFAFRQKLYSWRWATIQLLVTPEKRESQEAIEWITQAIGPRAAHKDWLDQISFHVEPVDGGKFVMLARFNQPICGKYMDVVTPSDETRELILAAGAGYAKSRGSLSDL